MENSEKSGFSISSNREGWSAEVCMYVDGGVIELVEKKMVLVAEVEKDRWTDGRRDRHI